MNRRQEPSRQSTEGLDATSSPPFVGRERQLLQLQTHLWAACAGHLQILFLEGESQSGKTRFLKEARKLAQCQGMRLFVMRGETGLAFLPFSMDVALSSTPTSLQLASPGTGRTESDSRCSTLSNPSPEYPQHGTPDGNHAHLGRSMAQVLMACTHTTPTVFLIDDLQQMDAASLALFVHVLYALMDAAPHRPIPLCILGAYQVGWDVERMPASFLRLQREPCCDTLDLPGFDAHETRVLLRDLGIPHPARQLLALVAAVSQGKPGFIQAVVHTLQHRHGFLDQGGSVIATLSPADLSFPEALTGTIVARLRQLRPIAQDALTVAALLGDSWSPALLRAIQGLQQDTLLAVLDEGLQQGLIRPDEQRYQFAHPLVRHVLVTQPSLDRRQQLHLHIACTLLASAGHSAHEPFAPDGAPAQTESSVAGQRTQDHLALEIASHLIAAGPLAEVCQVRMWSTRAGDRAWREGDWGAAARFYEAALMASPSADGGPMPEQAHLHVQAGRAQARYFDPELALVHYAQALEIYQRTGDWLHLTQVYAEREPLAHRLAPHASTALYPLPDLLQGIARHHPHLEGMLLAAMAEVTEYTGLTSEAIGLAQQALAHGYALGDLPLCAQASDLLARAYLRQGALTKAVEHFQTARHHAGRITDRWLQSLPLRLLPACLLRLGRLAEAEAVALEACDVSRKGHYWPGVVQGHATLAGIATLRGHFDAAERRVYEMLHQRIPLPACEGHTMSLLTLASIAAIRGTWQQAEFALQRLEQSQTAMDTASLPKNVWVGVFRQLLRQYTPPPFQTREDAGFALEQLLAQRQDECPVAVWCAAVELAEACAMPHIAALAYEPLQRIYAQGEVVSHGWVVLLPRILGVAAGLCQRWEKASACFTTAIEIATRFQAMPELGRAYLDYAHMLVKRNHPHHTHQVQDMLQHAIRIFDQYGMSPFLRRAHHLSGVLLQRPGTATQCAPGATDLAHDHTVPHRRRFTRQATSFLR